MRDVHSHDPFEKIQDSAGNAKSLQDTEKLNRGVLGRPSWIAPGLPVGQNHHSLTGANVRDAIRVAEITAIVMIIDIAPPVASKIMETPSGTRETQVAVPGYACPVEFQALHLELRGCVFKIVARPRILLPVEKPDALD